MIGIKLKLLVLVGLGILPNLIFAQAGKVFWPKVNVPNEVKGRWHFAEKDFWLDFQKFGVNRDNQTWPYQKIQKRGDTLLVSITFRFHEELVDLEIIPMGYDSLKIRTDAIAIFLPTITGDFRDFIVLKRWNSIPQTPQEFYDHALMCSKVISTPAPKDYQKHIGTPIKQISGDWVSKAKKLNSFPDSLVGVWMSSVNETPSSEGKRMVIHRDGILLKTDQVHYIEFYRLNSLWEANGRFTFSGEGTAPFNTFLFELRKDTLIYHYMDWGWGFGLPPIIFTKKRPNQTTHLPKHFQKTYLGYYGETVERNPVILHNAHKIKMSGKALFWEGHRFKIKRVYENQFFPQQGKNTQSYDVFVEDPVTHQEKILEILYSKPHRTHFLYAFDFPTQEEDNSVYNLPWHFYLPKSGALTAEEIFYFAIASGATLFLMIIFLFLRNRRIRRQRQQAQLALRGIRAQLNPHFLFNALASIQSLVNRNDQEGANRYLSGFSKLLRHTLYHSEQDYISLEEELAHLRQYCELEALRSPFEYTIKVAENIDVFNTEVPSMLLQPYVENAILHGLREHPGQPKLEVWIHQEGKNLRCEVSDNGQGIKASQAQKKGTAEFGPKLHGMGLSAERIRLLNLRLRKKITLEVIDRQQNEKQPGTRILINIPQ